MKGKKGQTGGLLNTIIVVVFALAILGIGFIFIQELLELDNLSDQQGTTTEGNVWINNTGYTLQKSTLAAFNTPVITSIINETGGESINVANATISDDWIVKNSSALSLDDVNITYTFLYGETPYTGVNDTITSYLTIPGLMGLLVLVVMVGIIIAIVIGFAPGRIGTGA